MGVTAPIPTLLKSYIDISLHTPPQVFWKLGRGVFRKCLETGIGKGKVYRLGLRVVGIQTSCKV